MYNLNTMNPILKHFNKVRSTLVNDLPKVLNQTIQQLLKQVFQTLRFAILVLLMMFNFMGNSQNTISLKMCHDSAMVNFPLANQKEKLEQINQLQQENLKSNYLPSLNFNAKATYQSEVVEINASLPGVTFPEVPKEQYSANIEINQLIYDGGNIKAAQNVSKQNTLVSIQKVEVDLYSIKEQITDLYFNCLLLQENAGILTLTHETIIEQKKKLSSAVNEGMALTSELDNLDAEILRLEQQIIELKSTKQQVTKAIAILSCIHIDENTELSLPKINTESTSQNIRPEQLLFTSQSLLLDAHMDLVQNKRKPTLGAFANAGYGKPGYDMFRDEIHGFYMVGAQFKWKIWDWKNTQKEKEQLSIQKLIIEDNRQSFDKNIGVSLSEAEIRKQKIEQLIVKDKAIIKLQTKISSRSADQMKNGTKTSADYLRDLNAEKQARINLESREIQLIQAQIDQLLIKGLPLF